MTNVSKEEQYEFVGHCIGISVAFKQSTFANLNTSVYLKLSHNILFQCLTGYIANIYTGLSGCNESQSCFKLNNKQLHTINILISQ